MNHRPEEHQVTSPPPKVGGAARKRRWLPIAPRRVLVMFILLIAVTSCTRARTAGLHPPESPTYAYTEHSVQLPGGAKGVRLDGHLVRPKARGKFLCAVLLHGIRGYWRAYLRYARALASRGIASLILDYYSGHYVDLEGLSVPFDYRKTQFELQNSDIASAAAAFSRNPVCAGGQVGLIGFSLGANKAFRTAAGRPEFKAVVAYYGPYDYVQFIRHRVNPLILALAGEDAQRWKSYLEKNSPLTMAGKVRADVLLFHGVEDRTIPAAQSVQMLSALQRGPAKSARIKLYEGTGHNFVLRHGRSAEFGDSIRLTVSFLRKSLASKAGL
ncbi:MAG: dienelactone hydrolase family protein [Nitrospinota bacterium]